MIDFGRPGIALFSEEAGPALSYAELGSWVGENRELLRRVRRPALAFLFSPNSATMVAAYLACLAEGVPLGLGEPTAEARARIVAAFRPTLLLLPADEAAPEGCERLGEFAGNELVLWQRTDGAYSVTPHPDLALLLTTSGSTGDAKLVRLSERNLAANARAIGEYLGLAPGEIAVQSLPLHYSYGLSVLNSHLAAGGAVAEARFRLAKRRCARWAEAHPISRTSAGRSFSSPPPACGRGQGEGEPRITRLLHPPPYARDGSLGCEPAHSL